MSPDGFSTSMLPWAATTSRSSGESTFADDTPATLGWAVGTDVRSVVAAPPAAASRSPPTPQASTTGAVMRILTFPSEVRAAGHRDQPPRSLRSRASSVGGQAVTKRLRPGEGAPLLIRVLLRELRAKRAVPTE